MYLRLFHCMPWSTLFLIRLHLKIYHHCLPCAIVDYTRRQCPKVKKITPNIKQVHEITSYQKGCFPRRLLLQIRCIFQAWFQSCKNDKQFIEKILHIATSTTGLRITNNFLYYFFDVRLSVSYHWSILI